MDESFALVAIQSALVHTRNLYEILLIDKIWSHKDYGEQIGHDDVLQAIRKIADRIREIEQVVKLPD